MEVGAHEAEIPDVDSAVAGDVGAGAVVLGCHLPTEESGDEVPVGQRHFVVGQAHPRGIGVTGDVAPEHDGVSDGARRGRSYTGDDSPWVQVEPGGAALQIARTPQMQIEATGRYVHKLEVPIGVETDLHAGTRRVLVVGGGEETVDDIDILTPSTQSDIDDGSAVVASLEHDAAAHDSPPVDDENRRQIGLL